jgi:hypothetical protein
LEIGVGVTVMISGVGEAAIETTAIVWVGGRGVEVTTVRVVGLGEDSGVGDLVGVGEVRIEGTAVVIPPLIGTTGVTWTTA